MLRFLTLRAAVPLFAVSSGILLALSFPPFNLYWAAYFFLAPIFYAARVKRIGETLAIASGAGLLGYGAILRWIYPTVLEYTGSHFQSAVSLFLISAYPSVYLVAFAAAAGFIYARGTSRLAGKNIFFDNEKRAPARGSFPAEEILLAAFWVALEYSRSRLFTGFPWALVGYSQWNFLPAVSLSRYTGVFGASFFIVLFNSAVAAFLCGRCFFRRSAPLAAAVFVWLAAGTFHLRFVGASSSCAAAPASVSAAVHAFAPAENSAAAIVVAVIQPNVDQEKKWDTRYFSETKEKISLLIDAVSRRPRPAVSSRSAAAPPAGRATAADFPVDVVLWPETSLTEVISESAGVSPWLRDLVKSSRLPNAVGALFDDGRGIYNAAILINPDGKIAAAHKKTHLVPFGEFVPFRALLEPYFGVFNNIGDLAQSRGHTVLDIGGKKFSAVICSENLFGGVTRRFVAAGAGALLVITNDAWYGKTPAAFQHFTFNVFRAAENDRYVVQAANTGVSGVVAPDGKIIRETDIFVEDSFVFAAPLKSSRTFYSRFGDVFAIICVVFSVGYLILKLIFGQSRRAP